MKKNSILLGSLVALTLTTTGVFAALTNFKDVPADHWAKTAVENLKNLGVIQGYEDGTFKGDQMISRYEVAAIIDKNNAIWMNKVKNLEKEISEIKATIDPQENISQLSTSIKSGSGLEEVENPHLTFPSDIHEGQVEKYFKIGDLYLALVLTGNMNIPINVPADFSSTYDGILIADESDKAWSKLLSIKDSDESNESSSTGNATYYLWIDASKLILSIVDQNGGGSGEGIEKVYSTSDGQQWSLEGCYYFGPSETNPNFDQEIENSDYFAYSKELSKLGELTAEQMTECKDDVKLTSY